MLELVPAGPWGLDTASFSDPEIQNPCTQAHVFPSFQAGLNQLLDIERDREWLSDLN